MTETETLLQEKIKILQDNLTKAEQDLAALQVKYRNEMIKRNEVIALLNIQIFAVK